MSLQTMNGPTGADLEGIQPGDKGGVQYVPGADQHDDMTTCDNTCGEFDF
jgi:hypothetical protein